MQDGRESACPSTRSPSSLDPAHILSVGINAALDPHVRGGLVGVSALPRAGSVCPLRTLAQRSRLCVEHILALGLSRRIDPVGLPID